MKKEEIDIFEEEPDLIGILASLNHAGSARIKDVAGLLRIRREKMYEHLVLLRLLGWIGFSAKTMWITGRGVSAITEYIRHLDREARKQSPEDPL